MFNQTIKTIILSACITGMMYADYPVTRGHILTLDSQAVMLSPVGGYVTPEIDSKERIGEKGLQKYYDDVLSTGTNVPTSIDKVLQSRAESILDAAKEACQAKEVLVMVMDSNTGAMLTMASSNRYNPLHIRRKDVPNLTIAFTEYPYEPGSVMMPFTVAMLLNSHLGEPNKYKEKFFTDYDKYSIDSHYFIKDDVKKRSQTMSDMLVYSSNIGIAQIAVEQIEPEIFSYALDNYGFGHKSGIDLDHELSGRVRSSKVYERKMHRANTGYGYGILVTPVQLLKAYSMFANEGWMVTPHIANTVEVERKEVLARPVANRLKDMLVRVVKEGTGKKAQVEGLTVGGKTGTAHIAKKGKYTQNYNSSFYGFVEDTAGHNYTIGVLVREPKTPNMYFASQSAVPVFKDIVDEMVAQKLLSPKGVVQIQSTSKPLRTVLNKLEVTPKHTKIGTYTGVKTRAPLQDTIVVKPFGNVYDKTYGIYIFNESVTLQSSSRTKIVYNVLNGKVLFAGKSKVLGKVIVMLHEDRLYTVYAGLSAISPSVKIGKRLDKGDMIGNIEENLIFQVMEDDKFVNPLGLIVIEEE